MTYRIIILFAMLLLGSVKETHAQNNRLKTSNSIGWYTYFGTFKLGPKVGIHTDYQWRRNNVITDWQQSLLRIGVNYQAKPNVLFRVGYAWVETFPYGDIPINSLGRDYTEHRIFEMAQLSQKEGIIDLTHRFMLEQRFVGKYSSAAVKKEDVFAFQNRARYMVRLQAPLKGKEMKDKTPYIAFQDEIFIGFGKNVNANTFDQNRICMLLGYRFSKKFRMEAGYLNQTLEFGRQINAQNVFQSNSGIIINSNFNIDLTRKGK